MPPRPKDESKVQAWKDRISAANKGKGHGGRKLTPADVVAIRRAALEGIVVSELAQDYDVCERTIQRVLAGETYAYVKEETK